MIESPKYPGWLIMKLPDCWVMAHRNTDATVKVRELTGGFGAWVCRKNRAGGFTETRVWGYGGAHVAKACEEAIW